MDGNCKKKKLKCGMDRYEEESVKGIRAQEERTKRRWEKGGRRERKEGRGQANCSK